MPASIGRLECRIIIRLPTILSGATAQMLILTSGHREIVKASGCTIITLSSAAFICIADIVVMN